jgi:hypothetical protein
MAVFPNAPAGFRALHDQISRDKQRGLTIGAFIAKYAPPNENDTGNYLGFVCRQMHCEEHTPLADVSKYALAGVIAQMEGYHAEK